ncbi:hypothetical protein SCG7086_AL_00020 [Chlamydiales bacterium SCGC AG-110-P3]|nr:hypothetical protein SCG7086_AL_00020 [Chlamydiales bacterium SCGC AG-110-P3]
MLLASTGSDSKNLSLLYQTNCTRLEIAENPLSNLAVNVSLKQRHLIDRLDDECLSNIWKTRFIAEQHLAKQGYENRLCYSKLRSKTPPSWQVVPYSSPPWYLDNILCKKIYSIWTQTTVLFRTIFPPSIPSDTDLEKTKFFWHSLIPEINYSAENKSGEGALTNDNVINKQSVYPDITSRNDSEILLLYNYAPLQTGGEQMHFLLVPNAKKPAKNFLELDKQQYLEVLSLTGKVAQWAEKNFNGQATIHFFDKTGEIAGQTQPLYHAHLIIVTQEKEEKWGKLAMFFRMLLPSRPLPSKELEQRVTHYKASLGQFLAHQH